MSIQTEKHLLIDMLHEINDISLIKKVKALVIKETSPDFLSENQKKELDKRILVHNIYPNTGIEGFIFLDNLKVKYGL
jgi:hypothetical protein